MPLIMETGGGSSRATYNSRQRLPSTDSEDSRSDIEGPTEGPGADEYQFTEASHPNAVLHTLNDLRKSGQFCDVTLSVGGVKFTANRSILVSFSPYFQAMFMSKMAESKQNLIVMKGIEVEMMSLLLDYAYTSTLVINRANVQSLLSAANLLQIQPIIGAACRFLEQHMDASNCLGIHCFAEAHACTDLQEKAKSFALKKFEQVSRLEEFVTLSAGKLVELTSSDDLEVDSEEAVFEAIEHWYKHQPDTRHSEFAKVLQTVRLPLLSTYYLNDHVQSLPVVKQNPECNRYVEEALKYQLLPDRRGELISARTRRRNNDAVLEVIVTVGGEDEKVVLRSVECFCVKSRTWRSMACLPFAVSKHGLVASGQNMLYLAGGEFPDGSASRACLRYEPALDLWQEMDPMLVPRSELGLAMLDGYVYAVGGWEGSYRLDSGERFDPTTNSWSYIAPMKMAVTSPAIVGHNGMLYVTGGAVLEDGDGIDLVQRYDPYKNTWTEVAPMLIPRSGAAICVLGSYIYVIGGWHASTENTNRVECYDVKTDTWTFKASMTERRYRPGIAVMDGKIYVLGGEEGWDRYHNSVECYDPEKDKWEIYGEMMTSRSWLSCVPLQVPIFCMSEIENNFLDCPAIIEMLKKFEESNYV